MYLSEGMVFGDKSIGREVELGSPNFREKKVKGDKGLGRLEVLRRGYLEKEVLRQKYTDRQKYLGNQSSIL